MVSQPASQPEYLGSHIVFLGAYPAGGLCEFCPDGTNARCAVLASGLSVRKRGQDHGGDLLGSGGGDVSFWELCWDRGI
jgi:hypothetical protein